MSLKNIFNFNNLKSIAIILSSIIIFYMWDFGAKHYSHPSIAKPWWDHYYAIDKRLLTLLPLLFFLKKDSLSLIKKGFFPIIIIWLYVFFQYIFNFFKFDRIFTITDLKYFFAFSSILLMIFLCKEIILLNKKKITKFLICLAPLFLISGDFVFVSKEDLLWQCKIIENNSSIFKLVFLESSHFGMVAIPAFLLNIFYLCNKFNLFNFLLIIIYSIIMVIFFSTTIALGTILSIIIILFTNFKNINKKFFLSCVIVLLTYIFLFLNVYGCSRKISDAFYHSYIISLETIDLEKTKVSIEFDNQAKKKDSNINLDAAKYEIAKLIVYFYDILENKAEKNKIKSKIEDKIEIKKTKKIANLNRQEREQVFQKINITSQVAHNSFVVALKTLYIKPFGVGLNRFQDAFIDQISNQENNYLEEIMKINWNDGSANINKLIGEFGYASFVLFAYFIFFICSKKISMENKLFLFPLILTQTIRGAGYFNGGYLVAATLIILLVHDTKEKN